MPERHPVSPHTFHIPVMGTGFTVDTPLRVARYGISSVISLVDDVLIEQMREYHCGRSGESFHPITDNDPDPRANRITSYLNFLDRAVQRQIEVLRNSPFDAGSEITRYFEQLPSSPLRKAYAAMLDTADPGGKARLQAELRQLIVPGAIDVNIMTKLDRPRYKKGVRLPAEFSDAKAALRGFAQSTLHAAVVLSAGMSRDLYKYIATFGDFFAADGQPGKKITLKVSDYRSAEVQGAFFAKLGLWVSEYRVESGLNCGGHAFATKGNLLGPILEEFRQNRSRLTDRLKSIYQRALSASGQPDTEPRDFRITVQGGIGTAGEQDFLMHRYELDGTGWGSPFLLVPEAVNLDDEHLAKLVAAGEHDVWLSGSSPLGVPFWNLRTSASEEMRRKHISDGRPGSACVQGYLKIDTSITELPICRASREFQRLRLAMLETEPGSVDHKHAERESTLAKSCICHDLAGSATKRLGINPSAATAVCCGPNILNFKKISSLSEMIDHIYGRLSLLTNPDRPHVFVNELKIYIDYFRVEVENHTADLSNRTLEYLTEFRNNLLDGIDYYLKLAEQFLDDKRDRFIRDIQNLRAELEQISLVPVI